MSLLFNDFPWRSAYFLSANLYSLFVSKVQCCMLSMLTYILFHIHYIQLLYILKYFTKFSQDFHLKTIYLLYAKKRKLSFGIIQDSIQEKISYKLCKMVFVVNKCAVIFNKEYGTPIYLTAFFFRENRR